MSLIDVVVELMWSRSFRAGSRLALAPLTVALLAVGVATKHWMKAGLAAPLESATARTQAMLDRVRFIRQQAQGAER